MRADPARAAGQNRPRGLPGEEGIWVLVLGDMVVFALLFGAFAYARAASSEAFTQAQQTLSVTLGAVNTLLLLTSSLFVAQGVHAARAGNRQGAEALLALGWLCGVGFVGIKVAEYAEKVRAGVSVLTNEFFMYYFFLTGLHLVHVLIGLGVLAYLYRRTRASELSTKDVVALESGASFWHLVDLLWIVLFPLIYLTK